MGIKLYSPQRALAQCLVHWKCSINVSCYYYYLHHGLHLRCREGFIAWSNSLPSVLLSRTPCPLSQTRSKQLSREEICARSNLQSWLPPSSLILLKIPFWRLQKPIRSLAPFLHPWLCQTSLGQRHLRQVVNSGRGTGRAEATTDCQHPTSGPISHTP